MTVLLYWFRSFRKAVSCRSWYLGYMSFGGHIISLIYKLKSTETFLHFVLVFQRVLILTNFFTLNFKILKETHTVDQRRKMSHRWTPLFIKGSHLRTGVRGRLCIKLSVGVRQPGAVRRWACCVNLSGGPVGKQLYWRDCGYGNQILNFSVYNSFFD